MHTESVEKSMHDRTFGQDRKRSGERRTILVILISALTMVLEIGAEPARPLWAWRVITGFSPSSSASST